MHILETISLAIIQGLTEFLPISSSAHLILLPMFFGWDEHGLDFDIAVHCGTLCAVLFYFRLRLLSLANPFNTLTKKLILATLPVCIIGFLSKPLIEQYLRSPFIIAISTILFALALWYSQAKETNKISKLEDIPFVTCFLIGLAQAIALIPGTSRSGITITAALLLGLTRKISAEFSFLLSIPVIALASLLMTFDIIKNPTGINFDLASYLLGFIISACLAIITMRFFIAMVDKIGMLPFVIYRLLLGSIIIAALTL